MQYPLLVISRIETDTKDPIVALTFYPSDTIVIKPRAYETLVASYVQHFQPGMQLAEVVSDKGKRRLKILMRRPAFTEDERRALGSTYFSLLFGQQPGSDENKKGAADTLYYTIGDLCKADASSEEAWAAACETAAATIKRLAGQYACK